MSTPCPAASRLAQLPALIRSGYFTRMRIYFRCMYPLPWRLLQAGLFYAAVAILLCRVAGWPVSLLKLQTWVGTADLFLLGLILRLMDELKDLAIDRDLFPHRPVPSGRVRVEDIRITLAACSGLYLVVNLGSRATFWLAALCLAYAFLMFVHFFAPRTLRRHLPLALATHNPIVPLLIVLATALAASSHGRGLSEVPLERLGAVVLLFWFPLLGWELARKIRSAQEENDYVTYSRILGRLPATLLTFAVQTVPFLLGVDWAITLPLSRLFLGVLVSAYGLVLFGHLRFVLHPSPRTSRLGRFALAYTLLLLLATVLDGAVRPRWR